MHNHQATPEELLRKAPLFAHLDRKSLHKLADLCLPKTYPEGHQVIEEGSTGLGLFIITSGRLEVFKTEGERKIHLAVLHPGDILGEMALIDEKPRSASAVTLEPTECLLITRGSFQALVRNDPEIALCLLPALAERLREAQQRIITQGLGVDTEADAPMAHQQDDRQQEEPEHTESETVHSQRDLVGAMVQSQLALMQAGLTGLKGSVKLVETFLSSFSEQTRLKQGEELSEILRHTPRGFIAAVESMLEEGERLPERMVSRLRREWPRS